MNKKNVVVFLTMVLIFSFSLFLDVKQAKAVASGSVVSVSNNWVNDAKEWGLDPIAQIAERRVIAAMTDSIVVWINSGFDGDPTFITNPGDFLLDVANETTGVFIDELGAGFLCEPFGAQIQIALATTDTFRDRAQCTVLDVIDNYDAFMGDFSQGGWAGWISVTQNQENNPYGAYLLSRTELNKRISEQIGFAKDDANQGQGFISLKKCVEYDPFTGDDCTYTDGICVPNTEPKCLRYENQTPGKIISNQLTDTLGSPLRQLELADEISESITAMANALINQLVTQGLHGLTRSSGGRTVGTYYTAAIEKDKQNLAVQVDKSLKKERERASVINIEKIKQGEGLISEIKGCYNNQIGTITNLDPLAVSAASVPSVEDIKKKIKALDKKEKIASKFISKIEAEQTGIEVTRWFEWGTNIKILENTTEKIKHTGGASDFSENISELSPDTTYFFRAVAKSPGVGTLYGNTISFSTNSDENSKVITLSPTNITNNSAVLNGTIELPNVTNTIKWFEWGDNKTSLRNDTDVTSSGGSSGKFSETISNLDSNVAYYYRLVSRNSKSGGNVYGNILGFIINAGSEFSSINTLLPSYISSTDASLVGYVNPTDSNAISFLEELRNNIDSIETPAELQEASDQYNEYEKNKNKNPAKRIKDEKDVKEAAKFIDNLEAEKKECVADLEYLGCLSSKKRTLNFSSSPDGGGSASLSDNGTCANDGSSTTDGGNGGSGDDPTGRAYINYTPAECKSSGNEFECLRQSKKIGTAGVVRCGSLGGSRNPNAIQCMRDI